MKTKSSVLKFFLALLLIFNMCCLSACWDSRELDELFIVEGTAIDLAENGEYELTVQIGKTEPSSSSTKQQTGTISPLNLSAKNKSIIDAFITVNENCSKGLLFDHSQVLILGQDVAMQGIQDLMDVFIRVQEARIETPVVIIEGEKGSSVLNAKIEESKINAQFVAKMVGGLTLVSKYYKTRIIDIMHGLLNESHAVTIPMIKLLKQNDKEVIEFAGFAIMKNGVMFGKLSPMEVRGYVLAKGKSQSVIFHSESEDGLAGFKIQNAKSKTKIMVKENNGIEVNFDIKGDLELNELIGFLGLSQKELIAKIKEKAEEKAKSLVEESIAISKSTNTDIFGIGDKLWKSNPKVWKEIQENWEEMYPQIPFKVNVELEVTSLGDVFESLSIEKSIHKKEYDIDGN